MSQLTGEQKIFDAFFIVGLKYEKDIVPYIKLQHPKMEDAGIINAIPSFCFPNWQGDEKIANGKSLHFTFALQQGSGARKYGFCNRIVNHENDIETLCIVTDHPWFTFFHYLLLLINSRMNVSSKSIIGFLDSVLKVHFPFPGEKITVRYPTESVYFDGVHELQRPDEEMCHSDADLDVLFTVFGLNQIIPLFAACLEERRIVFVGSNISQVTSCCFALTMLLYPLKWQHIFIPVLPLKLIDYVAAPMPFIVGIHSSMLKKVNSMPTESLVMVNLDTREVSGVGNVFKLPFEKSLLSSLNFAITEDYIEATDIYEAFLQVFVKVFGTYRKFVSNGKFLEKDFIASHQDRDVREMLTKLINASQIVHQFIQERIEVAESGQYPSGQFELECAKVFPQAYGISKQEGNISSKLKKTKDILFEFGKKELKKTKQRVANTIKKRKDDNVWVTSIDDEDEVTASQISVLMFTPPHFANEKENMKNVAIWKNKFADMHKEINTRTLNTIEKPLLDFGMLSPKKDQERTLQKTQSDLTFDKIMNVPNLPPKKMLDVNALFDTSNPNNRPRSTNLKPQLPPLPVKKKQTSPSVSPSVSPRTSPRKDDVSPQISPRGGKYNKGDISPRKILPPIPKLETRESFEQPKLDTNFFNVQLKPTNQDDRPKSMNLPVQRDRPRHSMQLPGQRPPQYGERSNTIQPTSPLTKPDDLVPINLPELPRRRIPPPLPEKKKDPFEDLNPVLK